jgi:hypothetical protein
MCTFVTLIAATEDLDHINAILATRDSRGQSRRAELVNTPGLRTCLAPAEREYWLTRLPCDCGTYLGSALQRDQNPDDARAADKARYRRKGWSEGRIARALADKKRSATRPSRHLPNEDAAYWIDLLTALAEGVELAQLGLMHHFYRKSPGAEPETATRQNAGALAEGIDVLARMEDGVIYDFHIKTPRR